MLNKYSQQFHRCCEIAFNLVDAFSWRNTVTVEQCITCTPSVARDFACTSTYLIYCIFCSRCDMLYTGETGRPSRTMFGKHRRLVIANDTNQPAARHFNSGGYSIAFSKQTVSFPKLGLCFIVRKASVTFDAFDTNRRGILLTKHLNRQQLGWNLFYSYNVFDRAVDCRWLDRAII